MTDPLFKAVEALISPTRVRLYREDTQRGEWQQIPSLWDQLTSSAQWGSGEGGSSKFGSRPVISTGVVDIIIDITKASKELVAELSTDNKTRDTPARLRYIAANLQDAEQIGWWTGQLGKWCAQANDALRLDPRPRSVRGARCPNCGADNAHTRQDGETVKVPALAITWTGPDDSDYHPDSECAWKVRAIECRQCKVAWFRGDSMDALIDLMMAANKTRETMTDGVA